MATRTGIELLSALRRSGSISAIRDIPDTFFVEDDELAAFRWLRDHVTQHRAFPDPRVFLRHTGLQTIVVSQPLNYYKDQARQRALYNVIMDPFGQMRDAMEARNPDAIIQIARQIVQASAPYAAGSNFIDLETAVQQVVADFEQAHAAFGTMRGIPSGWSYVDEQTNGWQNDDLISIVGRIGVGKTYVLLFLAYAAWRAGRSVLFNTNELGVLQLARRLFGLHTRINPTLIRRGQLSTVIAGRIREYASTMSGGVPFNIVAGGFKKSVETVGAVAEATNPDIVFADASYLLEPSKKRRGSEGRRETVSDTIEDLKRLGIDINRPIVQSVQFNRQAEAPRRQSGNSNANPTSHLSLAKIGETDVIGQSSSVVAGIAKGFPPRDFDTRWWAFLKGREGESGVFAFNYLFNPVNFDIISIGDRSTEAAPSQDLSHMI